MKLGVSVCFAVLFGVSAASASSLPGTNIQGQYVEARTADVYTGPCFANAEVGQAGDKAVFGWNITKGTWEGVKLDGLAVAAVIKASHTLGDTSKSIYPVKSVLIIDEKASAAQRAALRKFAQRMSGDLLQEIVKVEYLPVSFTVDGNIHMRKATLRAGTLATVQTRPIQESDHICHNEQVWYQPLTRLEHAMAAVAVEHNYTGEDLNNQWSSPDKRSAFVGTFHLND